MQPSDEELYRLMKKGSQDAFAQLYDRRHPALYRFAPHMSGSPTVAEVAEQIHTLHISGTAAVRPRTGAGATTRTDRRNRPCRSPAT